jgi:hypothetical protein
MSIMPDAGNAPQAVGNAPPDRVSMTPEEHMNATLDWFRSGLENQTLQPEDMQTVQAFMEGMTQLIQGALGGAPEEATPTVGSLNGPEVPYGSSPDDVPAPTHGF